MNLVLFARPALGLVTEGAALVFDRLVWSPLMGLAEVSEALAMLLPDLTEASVSAVVQAVTSQLSTAGRMRVAEGLQRLSWGLEQLVWPVALIAGLLFSQLPSVYGLAALAALLLLSCIERRTPTRRLVPMP